MPTERHRQKKHQGDDEMPNNVVQLQKKTVEAIRTVSAQHYNHLKGQALSLFATLPPDGADTILILQIAMVTAARVYSMDSVDFGEMFQQLKSQLPGGMT